MNRIRLGKRLGRLACLMVLSTVLAAPTLAVQHTSEETSLQQTQKLRLLSNRFRVDQAIDKIVFIIDRVPESAPINLVQPDGSKLYANREHENVKWMDGNAGCTWVLTPVMGYRPHQW